MADVLGSYCFSPAIFSMAGLGFSIVSHLSSISWIHSSGDHVRCYSDCLFEAGTETVRER